MDVLILLLYVLLGQGGSVTKKPGLNLTRQDRGAREYKTKKSQRLPPYPANAVRRPHSDTTIQPNQP